MLTMTRGCVRVLGGTIPQQFGHHPLVTEAVIVMSDYQLGWKYLIAKTLYESSSPSLLLDLKLEITLLIKSRFPKECTVPQECLSLFQCLSLNGVTTRVRD